MVAVRADAASADLARLGDQIRATLRAAYPGLPVRNLKTLESLVDRSLRRDRLLATLSTGFGTAALFLVSLGLFGVISQWATQRTREIGVRIALGATATAVRWMVLRQAFVLVIAGVALGVPAALAAAAPAPWLAVRREPQPIRSLWRRPRSRCSRSPPWPPTCPRGELRGVDPMVALRAE